MLREYVQQVHLVTEVLPFVAVEDCFAIKGGTAINLFELNLPRLSVDIDLTYVKMAGRGEAIGEINLALERIVK
jgi:predicted nucleotidyltransferase component of viral defense system